MLTRLFVGSERAEKVAVFIPGFCSSDPQEPTQFMSPGLYEFYFDLSKCIAVDDWVNGRDNVYRNEEYKPGVIGREGSLEVIINIPVKLKLVSFEVLQEIFENGLDNESYVIDMLLANKKLYGLSEEDILSLVVD